MRRAFFGLGADPAEWTGITGSRSSPNNRTRRSRGTRSLTSAPTWRKARQHLPRGSWLAPDSWPQSSEPPGGGGVAHHSGGGGRFGKGWSRKITEAVVQFLISRARVAFGRKNSTVNICGGNHCFVMQSRGARDGGGGVLWCSTEGVGSIVVLPYRSLPLG